MKYRPAAVKHRLPFVSREAFDGSRLQIYLLYRAVGLFKAQIQFCYCKRFFLGLQTAICTGSKKKNEEKRWRFVCAAAASGSPPICSGRSSGAYPSLKDPEEKQTVCECEPLRRRRRGLGSTPRSLKTPATTWNPPHSPSRATRTDPAPPRAAGRPEFDITYIFLTEECYLNRRVTEILLYIIHV